MTSSGKMFDPLDAIESDIIIEDIAHALSMICRANGQCKYFYSVAQHSINCKKEGKARGYSKKVQLACLLHDASEAYISDIIRPVKSRMPEYFIIEEKLQSIIYNKFLKEDLTKEEALLVKDVDDSVLMNEFDYIMYANDFEAVPKLKGKLDFYERNYKDIEKEFLKCFYELIEG